MLKNFLVMIFEVQCVTDKYNPSGMVVRIHEQQYYINSTFE